MSNVYTKTNRSVDRALVLLTMVCQSPRPLGLAEISREAGLDKATALRLLSSLRNASFIQQDTETKRYVRGPSVVSLWPGELTNLARPHLKSLMQNTQETACLIIPRGDTARTCIEAVHPDRELRVVAPIGTTQPIYGGAPGAVLLAFRPAEDAERILDSVELTRLTKHTVVDRKALVKRLANVRAQGFSILRGEVTDGTSAIAAPVFDDRANIIGAVVLRGPDIRMNDKKMLELLPYVRKSGTDMTADLANLTL